MVRAPQACSHEESTPPKFSGTDGPASRLAAGLPNAHYSAWHTGTLESAPAAALGPTLTDASAQPSCSPLRLPNAGCLCNVTATLALDMNPSLPAPSFSFLPGLVPRLPAGLANPSTGPWGSLLCGESVLQLLRG